MQSPAKTGDNRIMFLIPAWAWRGGPVRRGVCVGIPVGFFLATLVLAESGLVLGGVVAFVVTSVFYGAVMARRMGRFWPAAKDLSGAERVAVVRAARQGRRLDDARLASAAVEYALVCAMPASKLVPGGGWCAAAAAVVVLAVIDSVSASPRSAFVSWLFVVFFAVEIFWWPRVRDRLVVNAEPPCD